ncbi:MAG TPA: MFS transporter [Caulobacteraceae bacterium]|nr:MFS transporter [Caulobacteraceae bacterium]
MTLLGSSERGAVGPPLTPLETGSAIAIGVVSLLLFGVLALLLGALADENRLSVAAIGVSATLEALSTGAATGLAGLFLQPRRLRAITITAALALASCDVAVGGANGPGVIVIRTLAGAPEGVLLWVCIGMVARTRTPERWAAVLVTATPLAQFAVAWALAAQVLPRLHAAGGFAFMAACVLLAAPFAVMLPDAYAPLPDVGRLPFSLPARGWIALVAVLILVAASAAVGIYLVPLAHQAGLSLGVASTATAISLGAQVFGGVLAVSLAGRIGYFPVLAAGAAAFLVAWTAYGFREPAWIFIVATALFGFTAVFVSPFFVPMTIDADPSRRAALQIGAAQLSGAALGPLIASRAVSDGRAHGVLVLGGGLVVVSLCLAGWLHFTHLAAGAAE